jgi:hypothetical protein
MISDCMDEGDDLQFQISRYYLMIEPITLRMVPIIRNFSAAEAQRSFSQIADAISMAEKIVQDPLEAVEHAEIRPWSIYRAARAKVYGIFAMFTTLAGSCFGPHSGCLPYSLAVQSLSSLQISRRMSQDILDSVPSNTIMTPAEKAYSTGEPGQQQWISSWADCIGLFCPLSVVWILPTSSPEQSAAARAHLDNFGRALGIRHALKSRSGIVRPQLSSTKISKS